MVTKLRLVFSITILFLSFYATAQDAYWEDQDLKGTFRKDVLERFNLKEGHAFTLNERVFREELNKQSILGKSRSIVRFPNEDGFLVAYEVEEAQIFSEQLAKKYPNIKSYKGRGVENREERIRFSVSHKGIQSMITAPEKRGALFMQKVDGESYILYKGDDHTLKETGFICRTTLKIMEQEPSLTAKLVDDQILRKFRLAVAASGEYTNYHGGTKSDALAAINATLTRVNGVFERDLGVTLELIANTDEVIYLDPETDPFSGSLSSQAQNTFTNVIGEANYDVGHLFNQRENTLDGNSGFIGAVCTDNRKGSGYTTFSTPEGDAFDIDLVAHEIGHQFGANHSFSHLSEGTLVQVEPASGTTIMGYAGITGVNNVLANSDDYFHYVSIVQIRDYLQTVSCGETISLTNTPPTLTPVPDYIIPKGTAFALTGNASDSDVGDVLTYTWEQIDNGVVTQATFGPTNPSGALFRSLPPTIAPTRYFPKLERVLSGNLTQTTPSIGEAWETVPTAERDLNFSFTVRDNALEGGQLVSDEVLVSVINGAGPFEVTSLSTTTTLQAGQVQNIRWDVANTNLSPISASTVDILLSTDGGLTFPIVINENVPNDGSQLVVIPGVSTSAARIMVKASDNIFFAVNDANFTITDAEIVLNFSELEYDVCKPEDLEITFIYETYLGFAEESTFSVLSLPPGLNAVFTPNSATDNGTEIELAISGIATLAVGEYPLQVRANASTAFKEVELMLNVYDTNFIPVVLSAPVDGFQDASKDLLLEWEDNVQNTAYDVEIASDASFNTIIESVTVIDNSYPPSNLENDTEYFWRVKPKNDCGEGVFSSPNSFRTIQFNCSTKNAFGLPLAISSSGTPTITSKISFFEDLPLADINVILDVEHSFLADLVISLTSPAGTTVVLTSSSCGDARDIDAIFDDDATAFTCSGTPAINGMVKPLGSLSSFNGESILGEWILEIQDNAASDGGQLNRFSLEVCVEGDFRPDADGDGVFDDGDDLCPDTPIGLEVDASGCPIYRFPNENFSISLESETCRGNNDGQIQITPKTFLDYEVTISGVGVNVTQSFTDNYILSELSAGTYAVCINGTDGIIEYEEYCFEVVISEPQLLGVNLRTSLDGTQLTVNLEGSNFYNIELNGELLQTAESELTLDLMNGVNFLKVSTNLSCQGTFEEQFILAREPIVFPNPVSDFAEVFLGSLQEKVTIRIFSTDGRLVKSETKTVTGSRIQLDLTQLRTGIYYLQVEGPGTKATVKIIKE
jgi:subtilisin-like proprotein convertase family protein